MKTTIEVVRSSIRALLQGFEDRPLFNVRERDVQAELMFWTQHVALVTSVSQTPPEIRLSFAMMGKTGANVYDHVPLADVATSGSVYGRGTWQGFWTPT